MKNIASLVCLPSFRAPRRAHLFSLAALAAASAVGCSADLEGEDESDFTESAIIGGQAITVATQRSVGLVDVNGCSGSLITPHWALTATHCVDRFVPGNNTVKMARTDAGVDTRFATAVSQVGQTDITVLKLSNTTAGMMWPVGLPTRTMVPAGTNVVNQTVSCYGQGATAYASPSGVTGGGQWRSLTRTVVDDSGLFRYVDADNGNNILAPGDSGGACFLGAQIAATVSHASNVVCTDPTTDVTCKATLTKINQVALASTTLDANYINNAPARTGTATFRPLTLSSDWTPAFTYNLPGVTVVDGTVHLRGAMTTTGTSSVAFTLPVGYRPSTVVYVPINLCGAFRGRLHIQPSGVTSVQAEGATWSNAQCLTALDGASFLTSSVFTQLVLQNGWVNAPFSTRNAAVRLSQGIVQFRGAIASGANGVLFTLPAQFRPPTKVYANVDLCGSTKGRLNIMPNGEVTVQAENNQFSNAQCFTSLEGASFPLSAVAWNSLTPLNGWTSAPFSTRAPAATNLDGIIRLQGAVATTGTDLHAFTLPAQMRPATLVILPVDMCAGKKGSLTIQEDGRAFFNSPHAWSDARCFASLEGLTYGL